MPKTSNYREYLASSVSGKADEEHLENLESVLKRLQDAGLKANKEKCEFFRDRIQFCGHEID